MQTLFLIPKMPYNLFLLILFYLLSSFLCICQSICSLTYPLLFQVSDSTGTTRQASPTVDNGGTERKREEDWFVDSEPHLLVIESNDCGTRGELNVGCTDHYLSNVNSPALFHLQVDTSDSERNSA